MAQYRLSMKIGKQKSKNHYEYISRQGAYKNYNKGEDFIYAENQNLPSWSKDAKEYWKTVNELESGVQYREFEIALPKELTDEQNIKLVQDFCKKTFNNNYTYSFGIHKNIGTISGKENPHAHIMFSERLIDHNRKVEPTKEEYFKQRRKDKDTGEYKNGYIKDREITGKGRKQWLIEKRQLWAAIQNRHLLNNNISARVSHLSLEKQKIERIPQKHLGRKVIQMHKKGIQTDTYKNYQETQIQNKKILYTKQQILKAETIQQQIQKQEQSISEKQKELHEIQEKINKLPSTHSIEKEIKELQYEQKDYKSIIEIGEQEIKRYHQLKKDIEKYEQENLTATKILNKMVKSKDHEEYTNKKHELETLKENYFFERYAIKGARKEYKEKYKANEERLTELNKAYNYSFNSYQVLESQKREIKKEIHIIQKEQTKQEEKIQKILNEKKTQEIYAEKNIDILTKDGEIDYNKIKEQKITPYNDLQDTFDEIDDILYGNINKILGINKNIEKNKNKDYYLER